MTAKSIAKTFLTLIVALGICLLAGYIGGYPALSKTPFGIIIDLPLEDYLGGYPGPLAGGTLSMPEWYEGLTKPIFSPPSWLFSPIWMASFVLMGLVLFLILQSGIGQGEVMSGLILFCGQVLFTLIWAFAFFGVHSLFLALLCIIALWATLLCTTIQVLRFSVYGGMLLVPYFLWVCYLAYLNYGFMVLNNFVFRIF